MADLKVKFLAEESRPYTGPELRPHFLLSEFGVKGSALVAWRGPCRVETEHLVDWEDRLVQDRIEAREMVHFIGEFFGSGSLREGVLRQRLLASTIAESVREALSGAGASRRNVRREGDDVFVDDRKLTVSIVTASPVSLLLHAGVNIDPTGAPVAAIGLQELGIDPLQWVPHVLERFASEWESIDWACAKVRPVG